MLGNLEPEERNTLVDEIAKAINTLGWTTEDEVIVKIGGTALLTFFLFEKIKNHLHSPMVFIQIFR